MTTPIRVIQWTTGNVGRRSLHAMLSRDDIEVVGVFAHGQDKLGVDAAELAGLPTPSGVLATNDVDALIALRPDACIYNPLWSSTDELVRLLEAGINVCTTAGWINGTKLEPAERARIEDACKRGESSIFGSGAHPGMTNIVALALTASCAYVDRVQITESVDCSTYESAETQGAMGFGKDPATPGLAESVRRESEVFAESVAMMADAMKIELDRIDFDVTFTAATGHTDLGFMEIPDGSVGGVYGYHRGWVGDRNVISVGFNWTMGNHVVPPKPLKHGHDIQVFGAPNMRTVIHCLPHDEWDEEGFMGLGMIYTAMPAANAVPNVVAAPPGIVTLADLPVVTGRFKGVTRKRVVIVGLGDTGLLTAIHLSRDFDVVGISTKPELVSGQELGLRLARPDYWARDYRIDFGRYRRMDGVRIVHGSATSLDADTRTVRVTKADGTSAVEQYDTLVIATGAANGFWRQPTVQSTAEVDDDLHSVHQRLREASSIAVVGGGAVAVSSAANIAATWPSMTVDLFFPGEVALPHHHRRVWPSVRARLERFGVGIHPGHRASTPPDFAFDRLTTDPIEWSTGQPATSADLVLWAVGRVRPNTAWLPSELLDDDGFVRVEPDLRVTGQSGIFAIGDVAATDPLRNSARNRADKLLAQNIRAEVAGESLGTYRAPRRRWGSVLGVQRDGLTVFMNDGRPFRFPAWSIQTVMQPWVVRRGIYRGVRRR